MQSRFETMPARMRGRPIDHRGFPVPWFVTRKTPDGLWDFVNIDTRRFTEARLKRRCWVSGEPLGRHVAFVIGPMCTINRIASDPPVIPEMALWAATVCPFLSNPLARRPDGPPEGCVTPGIMLPDNPGICAVWITNFFAIGSDRLYHLGPPSSVTWWHKGQLADAATARRHFDAGAARIGQVAALDGPEAVELFEKMRTTAEQYLPQDRED